MTPETVLMLVREALEVALAVSAPMLGAALVTGLVVGVLQAATQVNEMTLSFIPKLVVLFVTIAASGPWMLATLTDYTRRLITALPQLVG
jgi:flagellar biosynthetic protein FliQ